MKKIFIGLAMLCLSSCYLKGDYTLGRRNTFNDFFYTYNIRYYADGAFSSAQRETETISDYQLNKTQRAVPGGIVVSSRTVEKEVYSDAYLRPSTKGALVSYTVPVEFSDEKVYKAIGEVEIKGAVYRLLEPNRIGDVLLIDAQGKIYHRVGRIYNNRLALLDTAFLLEPDNVRFLNETQSDTINENTVSGFEVRYLGIDNYRMVFRYILTINGVVEEHDYSFPIYDQQVSFEGIVLDILEVNDTGISYRIISM